MSLDRSALSPADEFPGRHIGPSHNEQEKMLQSLGMNSLKDLIDQVVPKSLRMSEALKIPPALTESEALADLAALATQNSVYRSYLGMGYSNTLTPSAILRNVLENPGWYTQYTPYQAEISQGRLEAMLNFQTLITDLTGLAIANSSLLDEGTAAAEAMTLALRAAGAKTKANVFFASENCHEQTLAILRTRAEPLGVKVVVGCHKSYDFSEATFGVLVQYPDTNGTVLDYQEFFDKAKEHGAMTVVAADLLSLVILKAPADFGADVVVGNSQRFGVPLGFGGPHAAFMATHEVHKRRIPGRVVGVSKDAEGRPAMRLALQTREQHIRRDRATSNICTAQVLLAVVASMYAVYHGPEGLRRIARRVLLLTRILAKALSDLGFELESDSYFDTLKINKGPKSSEDILAAALAKKINLRAYDDGAVGIALDETVTTQDITDLVEVFGGADFDAEDLAKGLNAEIVPEFARQGDILTHPVFSKYHSETELMRYVTKLAGRDLSLTHSMIPLGSCTMKLNAATEMIPVTWKAFGGIHPFAPLEQTKGYLELFDRLEAYLAEITGFSAVSLQPNAGSQGEYAGLLAIRGYHQHHNQGSRHICLIPMSAHGTNPASAVMAGMKVVGVRCDENGNIDVEDLRKKAEKHKDALAALMVTYPSTHGVFEESIREICTITHDNGGLVYLDGANMNAMVGLCQPASFGADVCHLNLHKTFCLAKGTPVRLASGVNRPIEQLNPGQRVSAWSEDKAGILGAELEHRFATGKKECVEVTFADGRKIVCTPDHRVLTTDGWIEAEKLKTGQSKVLVGPDAPVDDLADDWEGEQKFELVLGDLTLSMKNSKERERTLAFFRLLGAASSDGTYSLDSASGRKVIRLYFGVRNDAKKAVNDIERLCGIRPNVSISRRIFAVRFPDSLTRSFGFVKGFSKPGRRVESTELLPELVCSERTPKSARREFFGALFGGDGVAPLIVHLRENPNTIREVRFVQTRLDKELLGRYLQAICDGLALLGVEAYPGRISRAKLRPDQIDRRPRWIGTLSVVWGTAFAKSVGFRYCTHKAARLTAATAWWRLKETVLSQRRKVAKKALEAVSASALGSHRGPKRIWDPAVEAAYGDLAEQEPILNQYYTAFQGHDRVQKSQLNTAIKGQRRADSRGLRRSHKRANLPATNRHGAETGMPDLDQFFEDLGVRSWFNEHTTAGENYSITYATDSQDDEWSPTMEMTVIDVRPVGEREVYDLTVAEHHNFLANGIVVHNCIPHGGGGPGMGPIGVVERLAPFLPTHPITKELRNGEGIGAVASAPWGSPSILPISYAYIVMMGPDGLKDASEVAILNANYIASRLDPHFPVLYRGADGRVAHECIIDLRHLKKSSGVEVEDVAKRLMDYGFHAPTQSWPVAGTLMIEPTESESLAELDRFCEALIAIREEIKRVENGEWPRDDNPLKNAPHTSTALAKEEWNHPYSRMEAVFPKEWVKESKFWPAVARIDNVYGDRNLICSCPTMEEATDSTEEAVATS